MGRPIDDDPEMLWANEIHFLVRNGLAFPTLADYDALPWTVVEYLKGFARAEKEMKL